MQVTTQAVELNVEELQQVAGGLTREHGIISESKTGG